MEVVDPEVIGLLFPEPTTSGSTTSGNVSRRSDVSSLHRYEKTVDLTIVHFHLGIT